MAKIIFITSFLIWSFFPISFDSYFGFTDSNIDLDRSGSTNSSAYGDKSEKSLAEITTQRILIDGVWWIFVYEDGVLIYCYPEINSRPDEG